jgi:Domain of unknown function (DUF4262)
MTRDIRDRNGLPSADQNFLANIEGHGWVVTKVFRSKGETGPEFAYSTGLSHVYKHPEIIIFGLNLDVMHRIINNIGDAVKIGSRFEPGIEYQDIFAMCGCQFRPVDPGYYKAYLGWSIWFYEGYEFPVSQCFWPDREGHYPWDPECSPEIAELQPMLHKPS